MPNGARNAAVAVAVLFAIHLLASAPHVLAGPSGLPVITPPPGDDDNITILLVEPSSPWIHPGDILRWEIGCDEPVNVTMGYGGNESFPLSPPYAIDTTSWTEGPHSVWIIARDDSNRSELKFYTFIIDTTPPVLEFSVPLSGEAMAEPSNVVTLLFSERLNNRSVERNLTLILGPGAEGSGLFIEELGWLDGGRHLDIRLSAAPGPESYLMLSLGPDACDMAGNRMGVFANVSFRTWTDTDRDGITDALDEDDDADGTPDAEDYRPLDPEADHWLDVYWWVSALICVAFVAAIGGASVLFFRD